MMVKLDTKQRKFLESVKWQQPFVEYINLIQNMLDAGEYDGFYSNSLNSLVKEWKLINK